MTAKQLSQFVEIRRLLKEAYDDYFRRSEDGHCKSAEASIEVYYPNYWEAEEYAPNEACGIGIYSYVLGPSRTHDFPTFELALEAVKDWHRMQMSWEPE